MATSSHEPWRQKRFDAPLHILALDSTKLSGVRDPHASVPGAVADAGGMSQISVRRRDSTTIECALVGSIDAADIHFMRDEVLSLIAGAPQAGAHTFLVLQTKEMTAFTSHVRTPVTAMLRAAHAAGVELLIGVAPSVFARMTGFAIAMAAGIPLRVVQQPDDVGPLLAEERRKRALRGAPPRPMRPAGRSM